MAVTSSGDMNYLTIGNTSYKVVDPDALHSLPDHTHGNIQSGGTLQTTDVAIATGDKLVVTDSSNSNKVARTSISFDTGTGNSSKYLSQAGTWVNIPQGTAYSAGSGLSLSGTEFNHSNSVTAQSTQAVYPITIDAEGHIASYGTAFSESDPVFSASAAAGITSSDITNWNGKASYMLWCGTCSTTASTAEKAVSCLGYTLQAGSIIGVLFTAANTAATPTLNINSTTAKSIYVGNSTPNSTTNVLKWSTNTMIYFMYDGTYYRYITSISAGDVVPSRGANTWYGTSSTGASTQAKTSTIDNYVLTKGSLISITFSAANTYKSGKITLNINSTGAKDVYANNAVTSSTNTLLWDANETVTFMYDGTGYYFICKTKASYTETDPVFSASAAAGISSSDITNWNGKTSNTGTVTSVRVQATSPVQSSTSTEQTASLNTTISLADAYGDTKNPYGTKTPHYVLAGPSSGTTAAAPSFRALVAADIPDLSGTYLTSYTETDPVFTASAAHGISASDITNWNGKASQMVWYGTSSTTNSTAAKVVTCSGYTLQAGSIIGILFSTANTAATPTLNVNSTGAKNIHLGSDTPNATTNVLKWSANSMLYFMYDGSGYRYITAISPGALVPPRGANTWYGTSSTVATTAAKTSTIDNYVLTPGSLVSITFSTANTVTGSAITLNVNSTGAKTIYYNNAATSSSNTLLWDAGETVTFIYSSSYYYFVCKSTAAVDISGKVDVNIIDGNYESHIYNSGGDGVLLTSINNNASVQGSVFISSDIATLEMISQGDSVSTVAVNTYGVLISSQGSSGVTIQNVVTPTNNTDVANKAYVDGLVSALTNTEIDNAVAAAVTVANGNNIQY